MDHAKMTVKGQVNLEFVMTFTLLMVLLMGTTKIFIWATTQIIKRDKAYQATRMPIPLTANIGGTSVTMTAPTPVYFYDKENLTMFKDGNLAGK